MIPSMLLPWRPFFAAGSISGRIDFVVYCRIKTCSLSVSLYRDVEHYGKHMTIRLFLCSKRKILGLLQRGTGDESVATTTS